MSVRFSFVPFVRPKLLKDASGANAGDARLRLKLEVEVVADGRATGSGVSLDAPIKGPGDIIGLDRSAIAKVEPDRRHGKIEANYIPYVELSEADLPWRYTLERDGSDGRVQPWLVLIVLKDDEFDEVAQGAGPLPRISVKDAKTSLPDLSQASAFAHVHIDDAPQSKDALEQLLQSPANRARARLLAARRLEESTRYTLCLVPSYEVGRLAGLGETVEANPFDLFAWSGSEGDLILPVYFSTTFHTNSAEDLETALRRLRAIKADEPDEIGAGSRVFAGAPGHYDDYSNPDAGYSRQAAMRQPGSSDQVLETDPKLVARLKTTLDETIVGQRRDNDDEDPLVCFPAYGARFRGETEVKPEDAETYWFDQLNLDLKYREAAGIGALLVQKNQDRFMRLAWAQHAELAAANRELTRLETAGHLVRNLGDRRFATLDADVALTLAEPVQGLAVTADRSMSLRQSLESTGAPVSYASRDLRRLAARRARPLQEDTGKRIPAPTIPGDGDAKNPTDRSADGITREAKPLRNEQEVRSQLNALMGRDIFVEKAPSGVAVAVGGSSSVQLTAQIKDLLSRLPAAKANVLVPARSGREREALGPVLRAPRIPIPLAQLLATSKPDAFVPNVDQLPDNTIAFLEENRAFIEAFMIGANQEMNRELRWRGFATDMRGTAFRRFWPSGFAADDAQGDDIAAIHTFTKALGQNHGSRDADGSENLLLVLRGDVVRKIGLAPVEINIAADRDWKPDEGIRHRPAFFGRIGQDTLYFSFDVSRKVILENAERAWFVIYEPTVSLRFGLDTATKARRDARGAGAQGRTSFLSAARERVQEYADIVRHEAQEAAGFVPDLNTWDDLSWSHVTLSDSGYLDTTRAIRPSRAGQDDLWGGQRTSASIARSLVQKPIVAALPLARVL